MRSVTLCAALCLVVTGQSVSRCAEEGCDDDVAMLQVLKSDRPAPEKRDLGVTRHGHRLVAATAASPMAVGLATAAATVNTDTSADTSDMNFMASNVFALLPIPMCLRGCPEMDPSVNNLKAYCEWVCHHRGCQHNDCPVPVSAVLTAVFHTCGCTSQTSEPEGVATLAALNATKNSFTENKVWFSSTLARLR
eukprot:gnl/TRDRNA2_/TRDRNA2_158684_c1_seq2.p1 gnl/TRDRNA2_/TRDRNA2_158684_c1~~gnl/TRDRNA2_/TRDRNA2_158684_c1_seq2.p1  ORF type:complete len:193 (+),score=21.66 gnl/TRDRNA2_/TRDRNA2_158684_c1_seq2:70-648(+)